MPTGSFLFLFLRGGEKGLRFRVFRVEGLRFKVQGFGMVKAHEQTKLSLADVATACRRLTAAEKLSSQTDEVESLGLYVPGPFLGGFKFGLSTPNYKSRRV